MSPLHPLPLFSTPHDTSCLSACLRSLSPPHPLLTIYVPAFIHSFIQSILSVSLPVSFAFATTYFLKTWHTPPKPTHNARTAFFPLRRKEYKPQHLDRFIARIQIHARTLSLLPFPCRLSCLPHLTACSQKVGFGRAGCVNIPFTGLHWEIGKKTGTGK